MTSAMANSTRYRKLRARIGELRRHFLPSRFDATGDYSARQFDRARAFRLLAHAEIECFLEDVAFDTANEAFQAWKKRGIITRPLVAMVAYAEENLGPVPERKTGNDFDIRMRRSLNGFNSYAKSRNHGIRERDVLKLLLPVGIDEQDIDSTWLATTSSFGSTRGDTAHRSNQVDQPPDPRNELSIVTQILEGLADIDERLLKLRSM